jgi:4-amino-4-deoxy-L-arabinose transferase-like glycosyltransferase
MGMPPTVRSFEGRMTKLEKRIAWAVLALLGVALFWHLGLQPLIMEEPRRAGIALEMLLRNNFIVPTDIGRLYFKKPPLYNWALLLSYTCLGITEFATRVPNVLSFLAIGGLLWAVGHKPLGNRLAIMWAFAWFTSADLLYYGSMVAEIDLFYSLLVLGSFLALYHWGSQGKAWPMFLVYYPLCGLALLTKPTPSIVFGGLSMLAFLVWSGRWRWLYHPANWVGLAVGLAIPVGYFALYAQQAPILPLLQGMWEDGSGRTIGFTFLDYLQHILTFPLTFLKDTLPWCLTLPLLFLKPMRQRLRQHPMVWFMVLLIVFNLPLYWLSPGARSRYLYMLYPLMLLAFVYLAEPFAQRFARPLRVASTLWLGLWGLLGLAGLALWVHTTVPFLQAFPGFTPQLDSVLNWAMLGSILLLGAAGVYALLRRAHLPYWALVFGLVMLRMVFNEAVLPVRAYTGNLYADVEHVRTMVRTAQGGPICVDPRVGHMHRITFYTSLTQNAICGYCADTVPKGQWVLTMNKWVNAQQQLPLYVFEHQTDSQYLAFAFPHRGDSLALVRVW